MRVPAFVRFVGANVSAIKSTSASTCNSSTKLTDKMNYRSLNIDGVGIRECNNVILLASAIFKVFSHENLIVAKACITDCANNHVTPRRI